MWIETPGRNDSTAASHKFIRQQWRMWIETLDRLSDAADTAQFIRQQWRMWIETLLPAATFTSWVNSFASNGECGLKLTRTQASYGLPAIHSPAMANVD